MQTANFFIDPVQDHAVEFVHGRFKDFLVERRTDIRCGSHLGKTVKGVLDLLSQHSVTAVQYLRAIAARQDLQGTADQLSDPQQRPVGTVISSTGEKDQIRTGSQYRVQLDILRTPVIDSDDLRHIGVGRVSQFSNRFKGNFI